MKVSLVIENNSTTTIELGYDNVATIVDNLVDNETNTPIFALLAKHSSVNVRVAVASKDELDESTVELLANDPDASVTSNLVRTEMARKYLTTEKLTAMIARNVDTAENIADRVNAFISADTDELANVLALHSDPRVRQALANNSGVPSKILKRLRNDSDSRVQVAAQENRR